MINIRKYANRRLYDLMASRYITLTDIEGYLHGGETISVTDHVNGQNITREVLLDVFRAQQLASPRLDVPQLTALISG